MRKTLPYGAAIALLCKEEISIQENQVDRFAYKRFNELHVPTGFDEVTMACRLLSKV